MHDLILKTTDNEWFLGFKINFRWLCNESLPPTSRRWSVEGLAYLTFDADVKEDLVEDKNALVAMFELAKV